MCILPQFFKDFLGYYYGTMNCAVQSTITQHVQGGKATL